MYLFDRPGPPGARHSLRMPIPLVSFASSQYKLDRDFPRTTRSGLYLPSFQRLPKKDELQASSCGSLCSSSSHPYLSRYCPQSHQAKMSLPLSVFAEEPFPESYWIGEELDERMPVAYNAIYADRPDICHEICDNVLLNGHASHYTRVMARVLIAFCHLGTTEGVK